MQLLQYPVLRTHTRPHCTGFGSVSPATNAEPALAVHRHRLASRWFASFSSDAGDGLDVSIAAEKAFDAATRTHRAGAQYSLLKRSAELATSDVEYFLAFDVQPFVILHDVNSDASGAGCRIAGVGGNGVNKQQSDENKCFHGEYILDGKG